VRERHRPAGAGFTILELLLVLAVIAGLTTVLSYGVKRVRNSDLRADTTRIAQSLRTAYAMATQSGKHHRVVFDVEKRTYQIEACEGDVKLHKERREEREHEQDESRLEQAMRFLQGDQSAAGTGMTSEFMPEVQAAMSPEEAAEKAKALAGVRLGTARCAPPTRIRGGKQVPDPRGKLRKLIKENKFEEIWVQHLEDPVKQEGFVSINFFPLGYAEKAVIEIVNDDDDVYTLLVHGVTGRVEFKDGRWRKPEEHMMRDARGGRVEERGEK
jgi:Tfp pilus assembly protein FimT